jgi:hypothetical protein
MSGSQSRFARRVCQRIGHLFGVKTDGRGQLRRLPCERCGQKPPLPGARA